MNIYHFGTRIISDQLNIPLMKIKSRAYAVEYGLDLFSHGLIVRERMPKINYVPQDLIPLKAGPLNGVDPASLLRPMVTIIVNS